MKILIIGEWHSVVHEEQLFRNFKSRNIDVFNFKTYKYFSSQNRIIKKFLRGLDKYSFGLIINKINKDLIDCVYKLEPDLLFFYRPRHIFQSTMIKIKEFSNSKIFIYNNDSPFSNKYSRYFWRRYFKMLRYADIVLSYRPADIIDYKKIGINSELFLPWYDPVFFKDIPNTSHFSRKDEFLFVGHAEDDLRIPILTHISSNLKLYGPLKDWSKKYICSELKSIVNKPIWGYDYYKKLCEHKIALCFLSKLNNDVYTRRCFEIPAAGTMLFSEYSEELNNIFGDMKGAVFFKDFEEFKYKLQILKENPNAIIKIAKIGKEIVLKNKFDVSSRVDKIISLSERK